MSELVSENRRAFLKELPRHLINGIRSIAAAVGAPFMAPNGKMNEWGVMNRTPTLDSEPRVACLDIAHCLAWGGANCQLCYLACPLRDQAIQMHDLKPVIVAEACDGCAMCVVACKTVNDPPALRMVGSSHHLF